MAKSTLLLLFFLATIAALLGGIKWNLSRNQSATLGLETIQPTPAYTPPSSFTPSPTLFPSKAPAVSPALPVSLSSDTTLQTTNKSTIFTDRGCGFSLTFPMTSLRQQTRNGSTILSPGTDTTTDIVVAMCASTLPKPPLPQEKQEIHPLDGQQGILYHDANSDGSPRDEIIVRHPRKNVEIILAGYGTTFQTALSSFRFLQ